MSVNVETGDGIPGWDLKIEGRLLDVSAFGAIRNSARLIVRVL